MFVQDIGADRKPKAHALGLGGDKWVKQPGAMLGWNTRAVVRYLQDDAAVGRAAGAQLDGAFALGVLHGLEGIDEEIEQHLANRAGVGPHGVVAGMQRGGHGDAGLVGAGQHELDGFAHEAVERDAFHLVAARVGEVEELLGQAVDAVDLGRDEEVEAAAKLDVVEARRQEVGEGLDRDERVADLVRQAGAEEADGGELLGLARLQRQPRTRQDVVHELGNFLELLDLGVGERAVVGFDAERDEQRRHGAAARRRDDHAKIELSEELAQVDEARFGALALEAFRRAPARFAEGGVARPVLVELQVARGVDLAAVEEELGLGRLAPGPQEVFEFGHQLVGAGLAPRQLDHRAPRRGDILLGTEAEQIL